MQNNPNKPTRVAGGGGKHTPADPGRRTAPTVSLPKDGEAICRIGEKFPANPLTGGPPAAGTIPPQAAGPFVVIGVVALTVFALLMTGKAMAQRGTGSDGASAATPADAYDLQRREIAALQADIAKLKTTAESVQAQEGRKVDAEIEKLRAEAEKLKADTSSMPPWFGNLLAVLIGFVGALVTGWVGFKTAMKARIGQFDMGLYQERLKTYGSMVSATKAFAMYFPERVVDKEVCAETGRLLRAQFFSLTGTLLTVTARKRYMSLLNALTRAARAERLNVPLDDDDYTRWISETQLDKYRKILDLTEESSEKKLTAEQAGREMDRCANHTFGKKVDPELRSQIAAESNPERRNDAAAQLFQDYVVLQFASSRLRTELSNDVSSRRSLADV